jgi:hypothetical protein
VTFDFVKLPAVYFDPLDDPGQSVTEGLTQDRQAGLANGRQPFQCPTTRTALPQLPHQDAVRQEDQTQVPDAPAPEQKQRVESEFR